MASIDVSLQTHWKRYWDMPVSSVAWFFGCGRSHLGTSASLRPLLRQMTRRSLSVPRCARNSTGCDEPPTRDGSGGSGLHSALLQTTALATFHDLVCQRKGAEREVVTLERAVVAQYAQRVED